MIRDRAKIGIVSSLFLALLVCHGLSVVGQMGDATHWWISARQLYQLASLIVTLLFLLLVVDADFLIRAVLRSNYIGGIYKGKSEDYTKVTYRTSPGRNAHIERFKKIYR